MTKRDQRSMEVAQMYANGFSTTEIGKKYGRSPRTVESYLVDMRYEYEARTTLHLIAILIRTGKIK